MSNASQFQPDPDGKPANAPYEWLGGSDTLFVCIHGFLGSPDSFLPLARQLKAQGYDCAAIQLPGHGGGTREFARSRAPDWVRHVKTEIDRLRPGYRRLVLVGHSLGCLLAMNYTADMADLSAGSASQPVDGLILFNTPLRLRFRPFSLYIIPSLYLRPPRYDDPVTAAYRQSYGLSRRLLNPFAMLPPAQATIDIMSLTRDKLPRITVPTLIIQALRDETASPASAREIAPRLGGYGHVHWLRRSRHAWIHPDELPQVESEIDRFLRVFLP